MAERNPVVLIQSHFDTSWFDANRSNFDTNNHMFRKRSETNEFIFIAFRPLPMHTAACNEMTSTLSNFNCIDSTLDYMYRNNFCLYRIHLYWNDFESKWLVIGRTRQQLGSAEAISERNSKIFFLNLCMHLPCSAEWCLGLDIMLLLTFVLHLFSLVGWSRTLESIITKLSKCKDKEG